MPKTHVFIDTNVFLSFFAYTNDDIEELKTLVGLIKNKQITLYLTQQVCREFRRNREGKILSAVQEFKRLTLPGLPRLLSHYPKVDTYLKGVKSLKEFHNELIERVRKDALAEELPADKLFAALIAAAPPIKAGDADLKAARERTEQTDPPGKDGSLGDRLNWELLLANVPAEADIHVVSKDGDFASSIDEAKPHPALLAEWKERKNASFYLHTELRAFLATHFPDIKVATDVEKRDAINQLKDSGSFERTHTAIAKLTEFVDLLTAAEVDELVEAGLSNSQIRWIGTDVDVSCFYRKIVEPRIDKYSEDRQKEIAITFGLADAEGVE